MPRWESLTPRERFEAKYIPEPNSGCWLWEASCFGSGYGNFQVRGQFKGHAHRYSWMLYKGEIPKDLMVLHKCDVRCCVNPDHLFIGDAKLNSWDTYMKGRANDPRGEKHSRARLTEQDVLNIRNDTRRLAEIGTDYGLDKSRVWKIKRGWDWRHSHFENPAEVDRLERGRTFRAHGENHFKAVLTETAVREIRAAPKGSIALARKYGVSYNTIKMVRRRRIWKHV